MQLSALPVSSVRIRHSKWSVAQGLSVQVTPRCLVFVVQDTLRIKLLMSVSAALKAQRAWEVQSRNARRERFLPRMEVTVRDACLVMNAMSKQVNQLLVSKAHTMMGLFTFVSSAPSDHIKMG